MGQNLCYVAENSLLYFVHRALIFFEMRPFGILFFVLSPFYLYKQKESRPLFVFIALGFYLFLLFGLPFSLLDHDLLLKRSERGHGRERGPIRLDCLLGNLLGLVCRALLLRHVHQLLGAAPLLLLGLLIVS